MITVQEVTTSSQRKDFLNFPLKMYKDNPCFVPPFYLDEKKIFREDYVYYDTCKAVYYNAYDNGKMVGRISGIIQGASNKKTGENRARFTRFDSIDDPDVAKALFDAVEKWASQNGMNIVCGPLGFSDLEREGLLIDGFNEVSTFEEQYNAPYYQKLIEDLGYLKEVDWTESKIYAPDELDPDLDRISEYVRKRYNLRFATARNTKEFLKRYAEGMFDLLDKSYEPIYGVVPLTDGMKKLMLDNFRLIIDLRYVAAIVDENDKVVCFGICFPSLSKAMQKSSGHLTPGTLIKVLNAVNHPEIIDFGLIGVDPVYLNKGVSTIIISALIHALKDSRIKYAETNLNLEENYAIQNLWHRFKEVKHKRRRSYVKFLE